MKTTTKNVIKKRTNECVKNKFVDFLHSGVEVSRCEALISCPSAKCLTQARNLFPFEKFLKNRANDKMNGKIFQKIITRLRFFAATQ